MEENIRVKIEESYNKLLEKPNIIYDIFKDFYGEEFVDMQGYPSLEDYIDAVDTIYEPDQILEGTLFRTFSFMNIFILVRFPEVRVTNENGKYIDIWELYVRVPFNYKGESLGQFEMNRAEYDYAQLKGSYMHSHVSGISFNRLSGFQSPCLGQGPIRATLASLTADFDELRWQLFCYELSKYVQVESLSGGPYRRLENIGKVNLAIGNTSWAMENAILPKFNGFDSEEMELFVRWLISRNKIKFDYSGSYGIAMSYIDWIIFVSNEFIEWFNARVREELTTTTYNTLLSNAFLRKGVIDNGSIYYDSNSASIDFSRYIGERICTFKGQEVTFKIRGNNNPDNDNMSTFINPRVAEAIYKAILQIVNYNYGCNNITEAQITGNNKELIFI